MKIPITKPFFGSEEIKAVQEPLESGWVVQGPFVRQFEEKFSAYTRVPFSVATSSCTAALHIAVTALGLKPEDEVIIPALTWVSTPNVVEYQGAKPVFCDIDLRTFNIDVDQIEKVITPRTVGIIPVHLFGLCADMDSIMNIAQKYHLWVIEDAACAFGAWYHDRHAGTFGEVGCFSFHPRKSITTGEGGMITTTLPEIDRLSRVLRDHGASQTDFDRSAMKSAFLLPDFNTLGYNYRMTDIQGALGCAQISRADWILRERAQRAHLYDDMLTNVEWLDLPIVPNGYIHAYQAYVCLFRPEDPKINKVEQLHRQRNNLMIRLEEKGIATRQGTHAPVILSYYVKKYHLRSEDFPNALLADRLSLTLPLYVQITEAEQETVCKNLRKEFRHG